METLTPLPLEGRGRISSYKILKLQEEEIASSCFAFLAMTGVNRGRYPLRQQGKRPYNYSLENCKPRVDMPKYRNAV